MRRILLSVLVLVVSFSSCRNDDPTRTIYVLGSGGNYQPRPSVWKNGTEEQYKSDLNAGVLSGFVNGTDVYVGGYRYSPSSGIFPTYWKNGVMVSLPGNNLTNAVSSIAVSGSDVYAVSTVEAGTRGGYWKNEMGPVILPHVGDSGATGVVVSGGDVYIAGYDNGRAVYWKNDVKIDLPGSGNTNANCIAVKGSDVYLAGYEGSIPVYWKNGLRSTLRLNASSGSVSSIFVSGDNVYVSGTQSIGGVSLATYWKDGVPTILSEEEQSVARSIFVEGNDVYVAGTHLSPGAFFGTPVYWKNGTMTHLQVAGAIGYAAYIEVK